MERKRRPLGVIILGIFNLVVLGVFSLLFAILPRNWQTVVSVLKEKGIDFNISDSLLKVVVILQTVIAVIFIISGLGLLLSKEWARKLTLYFAFFIVVIVFLSALAVPTLIKQAVLQIIYPGILILYFTRKNIEDHFRGKSSL